MALAPLRPTDPEFCGPYRLQGRLGAGGMGVVYLAFGPDNTPVALKVLQPALAHDEEYRIRFIREVSAARLVDSPYVAKVVAAETASDPLWLATEYIEGATLAHAVESNGPVPPDRLRGLAADLASAVLSLHEVGLVHRDLKPANVVLAWSGPKLIDFGIAKHEGATDLTQSGVTVGSLQWMSPEILNGDAASRASDVFAWGLCVAFAGTGRPPFGAGNPTAVAYRITSEQPDLRGLPTDLASLVAASLAKNPQGRPTAQYLTSTLGSRGPQVTAVALPRPEGGWTGPNPGQPPAAPPPPPIPSPPPPPQGSPGQRPKWLLPVIVMGALVIAAAVAITILLTSNNSSSPAAKDSPTPSASTRASQSQTPSPTPSASASSDAQRQAAAALDALLADSSQKRANVVAAVASVQNCGDPAGAATTLTQAANDRQAELNRLQGLDLSALGGSGGLVSTLTSALDHSQAADQAFAAWATASEGCSGTAPRESNYSAASDASTAATTSKQQFVDLWNPIAQKYGLGVRQPSDI